MTHELFTEAAVHCEYLKTVKGYDDAELNWVTVRKDSILYYFELVDDFQMNLKSEDRCAAGYCVNFTVVRGETLASQFKGLPNRRQRELAVTIRKLNSLEQMSEKIKDLEVEQIIESILADSTHLKNLLEEDRAILDQAEAEADNPDIPF